MWKTGKKRGQLDKIYAMNVHASFRANTPNYYAIQNMNMKCEHSN